MDRPEPFDPAPDQSQPQAGFDPAFDADATPFAAPEVPDGDRPEAAPDEAAPPSPQPEVDVEALRAELASERAERERDRAERERIRQAFVEAQTRAQMEAAQRAQEEEARFYRSRQMAIEQGEDPAKIAQATDNFHYAQRQRYEEQLSAFQRHRQAEEFHQNIQSFAQAVRAGAEQVAQDIGRQHQLTPQETQKLLQVHPDAMPEFAQYIRAGRQTQQRNRQLQASQQLADRQARGADRVGGANAGGGGAQPADWYDDYNNVPWQRAAQ
jgi:hypothetical protein